MNIANFVLQEPNVGTDINQWFENVVQKTNYCFFKFNDEIFGISQDRETFMRLDFPYELKQQLKK